METEKMISAEETAKRLGISRATLSRLVQDNRIGHYRIGQRTLFTEEILKNFIEGTFQPPNESHREAAL
jgi:excisionase family DNA binding protein